jgi:tetratricopeptide (TPR) repeat protein
MSLAGAARPEELDAIPVEDGFVWHPVRRRFDIRAFGVNMYTSEAAGRQIVEEHTEGSGHEEMYVVVRGRATFRVEDDVIDAPAGSIVFLRDSTLRRGAVAEDPGTLVLAVGGKPGETFRVSPWESWFAAIPAKNAERWDEAIPLYEEAVRERPDRPITLYALAAIEARAGRRLDALTHLQEAVRRDGSLADRARRDSDFAAIRREPGFPA